jgi:hypothetical protein
LYATPTPQYSLKATAATSPAHLQRNPFLKELSHGMDLAVDDMHG